MLNQRPIKDLLPASLPDLSEPKLKREFIKNVALLSQRLHTSGGPGSRTRKTAPDRWRIKDISELYSSFIGIGLSERDCYRFLMNYFGCSLRELFASHNNFIRSCSKLAYKMYMKPILSQIKNNAKEPGKTVESSGYVKGQVEGAKWVCKKSSYYGQVKDLINDPDSFINEGKIIKDEAGHTIVSVDIEGKEVIIKRYNVKNFWHRLKRAFKSSRANNYWIACHWLQAVGVDTIEPIGIIEKYRYGLKAETYFLSYRAKGERLEQFIQGPDPLIANRIVSIFRRMGWINFSHGDAKTGNFLLENGYLKVFDLDKAKAGQWDFIFKRKIADDYQRMLKGWEHLPAMQDMLKRRLSALKRRI